MCLALGWGFTHPCFHLRNCRCNAGVLYSPLSKRREGIREAAALSVTHTGTGAVSDASQLGSVVAPSSRPTEPGRSGRR